MIYELINPSDPISFHASDDDVARAVGMVLGRGKAGVDDLRGETVLPILFLSPPEGVNAYMEDPQWWGGMTLGELMWNRGDEVAAALDTLAIVRAEHRAAFDAKVEALDPGLRAEYLEAHADEERTSMNDYRAYARSTAAAIRARDSKRAAAQTSRPTGAQEAQQV